MNIKTKHIVWTSNGLFIVLYFVLTFFNRPAHDDYYSMFVVREQGVVGAVVYQYQNWCSRYVATFFSFLMTSIPSYLIRNLIMSSLLFGVYVFSGYRLLSLIKAFKNSSQSYRFGISVFFVSGLFYGSVAIGETWFWLSASVSYTLALGFALLGISYIFSKSNLIIENVGIALLFLMVGGMHELLAIMLLLSGLVLISCKDFFSIDKQQFKKLLFAFVMLGVALIILLVAPGNVKRSSFFESITIFESVVLNFGLLKILILGYLFPTLPYLILWALLFVAVFPVEKLYERITPKFVAVLGLIVGVFLFFYQLPVSYKTQDMLALRLLLPVTLLIFISLIVFAIAYLKKVLAFKSVKNLLILFVLGFQVYILIEQTPIIYRYSKAVDERLEFVAHSSCENEVLQLSPLPPSGWLYSSELTSDPEHYLNKHFANGLGLGCVVRVVEK